jgi:hypothetical protein
MKHAPEVLRKLVSPHARTGGWASDGLFLAGAQGLVERAQGLRAQGAEVMEVASANEGMTAAASDLGTEVFGEMTGAALALGQEMFQGTILADVAGQALSGVLTIAKEFPFTGPVVAVLIELKGMVEQYQNAEEECKRLVVWCVALNPEP